MAAADLSPTTITSGSASDPDYDISTEDSSENENKNTYTEASSANFISRPRNRKQCKDWSPQEFDDAKAKLKLYRPLLCPAEIKGKSVTDHQQDT